MKSRISAVLLLTLSCLPESLLAQYTKPVYISLPGPGNIQHLAYAVGKEKKFYEEMGIPIAQIVSFVREMIHSHRVSETTFQAIYGRLGEKGMVELTAAIGYYAMLACTLNTFDLYTPTPSEDLKI
ncbi:MAG: hypothetical protein HYU31_04040 [Deltaproteobacteria bacterium]|nr:hypothetical protein [Deltaproteobacteria bacterium]